MAWQAVLPTTGGVTDVSVVHLLAGPYVTRGRERSAVPQGSKRLLAFVALSHGRVERPYAAGALWPFVDDVRAAGNLRSALWRLRRAGIEVIVADKWSLSLADRVLVDVRLLGEWASRLIHGSPLTEDLALPAPPCAAPGLLPGWCDDWVIIERERMRQSTLHGLEALSAHLLDLCRYNEAIEVAMSAISVEPLRESAQRALLDAHLAQGNWMEADRCFEAFRVLLLTELGTEPSGALTARMAAVARGPFSRRPRSASLATLDAVSR
jgi:DNA-binding SARP family transcriptional activator